jgi:hypothetical protein
MKSILPLSAESARETMDRNTTGKNSKKMLRQANIMYRRQQFWNTAFLVGNVSLALSALFGCSSNEFARHELSGNVSYQGKPVPAGYLVLKPDRSKGNQGVAAQTDIRHGLYHLPANRGTIGGPHIVMVSGFDGEPVTIDGVINPNGKPLFAAYQMTINLPKATATHDIQVPATPK